MKIKVFVAVLLLVLTGKAHALFIETSVGELEVNTVQGSFLELAPLLTGQIWWGDMDLAVEIAGIIMTDLSDPGQPAPYFAYGIPFIAPGNFIAARWISGFDTVFPIDQEGQTTPNLVFGVVSPVSVGEPPTLSVVPAGVALLVLGQILPRKRAAA